MIEGLQAPLNDDDEPIDDDANVSPVEKSETNPMFYISSTRTVNDYKTKSISVYLEDEDKLRLLAEPNNVSTSFELKQFLRGTFQSSQSRGKYVIGLKATDFDYLLDKFGQIAQTKSFFTMLSHVNTIVNRLVRLP